MVVDGEQYTYVGPPAEDVMKLQKQLTEDIPAFRSRFGTGFSSMTDHDTKEIYPAIKIYIQEPLTRRVAAEVGALISGRIPHNVGVFAEYSIVLANVSLQGERQERTRVVFQNPQPKPNGLLDLAKK